MSSAWKVRRVSVNKYSSATFMSHFNVFGSALFEALFLIQTFFPSWQTELNNKREIFKENTKGFKYDYTSFVWGKRGTKEQQKSDSFKVRSK